MGCPIRTSADQFVFANPRSFSQLITSFFASESLGIPHTPFLTSFIRFTYVLDLSLVNHTSSVRMTKRNPITTLRSRFAQQPATYFFLLLFHQHVNELLC